MSPTKLGIAPRDISWFDRYLLNLTTQPKWMGKKSRTEFEWFFSAESELKKTGVVVPGTIVQANSNLFSPGDDDYPADMIFTLAPEPDLNELMRTSEALFDLKGKPGANLEETYFSRHLADEYNRAYNIPVSEKLTSNPDTITSCTIIYRKNLPDGVLQKSIFPVLALPESGVALILPLNLWSDYGIHVYQQFS